MSVLCKLFSDGSSWRPAKEFSMVWDEEQYRRVGKDGVVSIRETTYNTVPMVRVRYSNGECELLNIRFLKGLKESPQ